MLGLHGSTLEDDPIEGWPINVLIGECFGLEASLVSFPPHDFTNREGPGECACKP